MTEIIYGAAGTGKSTLMYKKIADAAESGKKVFLFVPDQFSFEAEKIIYKTVRAPYALNVTVTMFSRMAQRILQLYGETKAYADDVVKTIIMKAVLNRLGSEGRLLYFRRQLKNKGFPRLMLNIIGDLRGGGLTPSALRGKISDFSDDFSESLMNKLNDISEIFTEYDTMLSMSFDDRLDDVRKAADLLVNTDFFDGAVCFFDCFDDFSGSQLAFIKSIMTKAEKTTFTLTLDRENSALQHFSSISRIMERLKAMSPEKPVLTNLTEQHRSCEQCEIVRARDMWQECDWICSRIHELLDEGYRCRDIAILMPDKAYGQILESALKKYEIPAFIDIPQPLIDKTIVRFAIYALQALSFETEDVLRFVKSGLVRYRKDEKSRTVSQVQIDMLEQLCRTYDLRKKDWEKPINGRKIDNADELEEIRRAVIEPLQALKKTIGIDGKKKTTADGDVITEALCNFLVKDMDIEKSIYSMFLEGKDENGKSIVNKKKQDEYSSLWEDVTEIFESAHAALKNAPLTLAEYTDILTDIFTAAEIAKPPQVLDAVIVGDVERSRFRKIKAVFICGVNQGAFPRSAAVSGNFTGSETEKLAQLGITLGNDRITRASSELFKVYRCTSLPEEKLFITYPLLNNKFTELVPSVSVEDISKKFSAEIKGADDYDAAFYCRTEKAARRYLASIYSDFSKEQEKKAVLACLSEDGDKAFFEQAFNGIGERHRISADTAEKLLKRESYSPSALDKINQCKFKFFCSYGLEIFEEQKREISFSLVGTVVHYCLEQLITDYIGRADEFRTLPDKVIEEHVSNSIKTYLRENLFEDFGGTKRFSYQVKRLADIAVPAAVNVRNSIANGSFFPAGLEKQISFRFGDVTIKGVCDRYDICINDSGKYIRVIDYKRGKNSVPLDTVYRGENLQMFLYLFGLSEELDMTPSSVLYQPVNAYGLASAKKADPTSDINSNNMKNANEHKANGIMIADTPEVDDAARINDFYIQTYGKRRNGYVTPDVISEEGFRSMKEYCKAYVNAIVMETANGMISACPKDEGKCKYCEYSLFCGHEPAEDEEE